MFIPGSRSRLSISPEYVPFTNAMGVGSPEGARRGGMGDRRSATANSYIWLVMYVTGWLDGISGG